MFAAPAALKRWLDNGGAQHPARLCRKTEAGASAAAASTPLSTPLWTLVLEMTVDVQNTDAIAALMTAYSI